MCDKMQSGICLDMYPVDSLKVKMHYYTSFYIQPSIASFSAGGNQPEAGPGARLTCHLLRRLCKKAYSPPSIIHMGSITSGSQRKRIYHIKYPCDRNLLSATHSGMQVEAILAVLKAIMVLGKLCFET